MTLSQEDVLALGATIKAAAEKACGNSATLKIPKDIHYPTVRTGLFASLQSAEGHKKLAKVMYKLGKAPISEDVDNAISKYLGARWYGMLVFVVSIVVFLIGIYLMCTVSTKVRDFSNRIFCCRREKSARTEDHAATAAGRLQNRQGMDQDNYADDTRYLRSMLTRLSKRIRLSLLALCIVCFCSLMIATGFAINSAIDMNESKNVVECNMWMELNGYFNGAQGLKPEASKFARIAAPPARVIRSAVKDQALSNPEAAAYARPARRSLLRSPSSSSVNSMLYEATASALEDNGRVYMGASEQSGTVRGEELIGRITTNWLGASELMTRLNELSAMTALDATNEVYKNFTEGRQALEVDLRAKNAKIDDHLALADELIARYTIANEAMKNLMQSKAGKIGRWDGDYKFVFALKNVYTTKANLFKNELIQVLDLSFKAMDALIEKYAGRTSPLMNRANSAVLQTTDTILQINASIKALYEVWDENHHLLTALVALIIVFLAVYLLSAFIASLLAIYLSVNLVRHPALTDGPSYGGRHEASGVKWSNARSPDVEKEASSGTFYAGARHIWRLAFAICALAFGCSAFATGLTYLVALVGSDSCQVANTDLLDNGDWNLLGRNVLYPNSSPDDSTIPQQSPVVDMKKVLDVCVKRSGQGTIGVTLGLDQPISQMSDDVDSAITEINQTRDRLLLRDSREQRVKIVGFMMKELLRGWIHQEHFDKGRGLAAVGSRIPAFNGFLDINWENHHADKGGRRVILGFVSSWPQMVEPLTQHGIFFQIGSFADAYQLLNDVSDAVYAKNNTTTFPRFCGATAINRQLPCSQYGKSVRTPLETAATHLGRATDAREVVDLSDDTKVTAAQIAEWVGFDKSQKKFKFDEALPSFGEYYSEMGSRVYQLISALAFVEQAAQLPLDKLGLKAPSDLTCVHPANNTSRDCVFDDLRLHDVEIVEKDIWPPVFDNYESINSSVDDYVDGLVIPSSRSIVEKANDLISLTNCQFQRGVLDYGVVTPLCANVFPAITELSVTSFVSFVIIGVLLFLLWAYRPLFDEESEVLEAYYNRIAADAQASHRAVVAAPPQETPHLSRGMTGASQAQSATSKGTTFRYQNLRDVSSVPHAASEHESVAVPRQSYQDTQSNYLHTTTTTNPTKKLTQQISGSSAYATEHEGLYAPATRKDTAAGSYESVSPHVVR